MRERRRRLSMTPLIDVIFLLLQFFMLSSTFSRFGEIELTTGGTGGASAPSEDQKTLFVRLNAAGLSLNGQSIVTEQLAETIPQNTATHVLLDVLEGAKAQGLADVLFVLRALEGIRVTVVR